MGIIDQLTTKTVPADDDPLLLKKNVQEAP